MQNWFFKYKIYHIPFWVAYHLLWMMINVGNFDGVIGYLFKGELPVKFIGCIIFQAAGAYFNLYYLIPKFLYVGKYRSYIFLVILTVLICTGFITAGYFLNAYYSKLTFLNYSTNIPTSGLSFFLQQHYLLPWVR